MCGIAGILNREAPERGALDARLLALQNAVRHRGPDDEGRWISPSGRAAFAHTRLSILDLSAAGHQPMHDTSGRFTITFNGEIYNFRELRESLARDGVAFHTDSDTEVLLALYARRGEAMVRELRGMFAFAIWDEREQTCFLARDPFGIKPLYYAPGSDGSLSFASELHAPQKAGGVSSELEPAAVMRFFRMGSVAEPLTLVKGVFCLESGTLMRWKNGVVEKHTYWTPRFVPDSAIDLPQAVSMTRQALLDTISHHFVSDVPVGIFLSGGIDSTALLALARQTGQRDISTFSVGVDDPALDETSIAQRTARHFGSHHFETRLGGSQGTECLMRYMERGDQPSIDGFNTFVVSEFARSHGMKVVLSGLGGDEIFGGYPSFKKVPQLYSLSQTINALPLLGPLVGRALNRFGRSPRFRRLGAFIEQPSSMLEAYRCFRGIFPAREARTLTARVCGLEERAVPETLPYPHFEAHDERDIVSALELTGYMRHQLLRDSDVMSMAHALELRVPFVDTALFQVLSRIPAEHRLQEGKRLLLQAVPEVPEWVASQPKRGFVFPFEKWMQEDWHKSFADIGRVLPGPNPTWYQRWAVFMLQNWATKNGVNASSLSPGPKTTVAASSSLPTTTKPLSPIHFWVPGIREGSGGIQGFCRDVLQALKVSFPGRPIHVLIKNDEPEAGDTLFGGLVTWSSSQNTPAKLRTAGFALKGLLACVRQRPAFILSGHVNFLPAVHSLKRGFGTPFAVFMYGIDVWEPLSRRVRSALRSADLVCSISRYTTAQASKAQGINSLSIVPFPCTFNDERYVPGPKPPHLLQRYGLRADQPVIFTVSRLAATERYKGHEQVLDALHEVSRRFPDLCYIIGGTGDYAHVLRARAAELGLADRVIFAGFIPNDELCAHYQLCDVFIMPSRKEGFGIVFVEAASCGKPVIGGNQDGSVDALADGKIGVLVDPADVPGIAQAIIQTLDKTHPNTLLFDPHALHEVTANTFGPQAFQTRLRDLLTPYL